MLSSFDWLVLKRKKQHGQGLVEYALILVLVAVVVIAIVSVMGGGIRDQFCNILSELGAEVPTSCTNQEEQQEQEQEQEQQPPEKEPAPPPPRMKTMFLSHILGRIKPSWKSSMPD